MNSNRTLLFLILVTLISSMKCFVLQLQNTNSFELNKLRRDLFNEIIASQSTCRDDTECAYGGTCKDFGGRKNCVCKPGLEGDFCQVVIDCVRGKYKNCRGEKGTCLYTTKYEQAICACSEYQVLDEENNVCKEVRCEKRSCHGGTCRVIGGVEICTCPPRHYLQEDTCIEMNKCEDGSHTCPQDSTECVAVGKKDFYCKCKAGYKLDYGNQENNKAGCRKLTKCEDGSHTCPGVSTICVAKGDDYRCECKTGYKLGDGRTRENNKVGCTKMNRCEEGSHTCPGVSTTCVPKGIDDFHCECKTGYKLEAGSTKESNKVGCIKMNRCEEGSHTCPGVSTTCVPKGVVDYHCECKTGYKLEAGRTKENNKVGCIKMNRCEVGSHTCPGVSTTCVPEGTENFHCECKKGYKLETGRTKENNKVGCIKMNKCEDGSHTCPGDSTTCVAVGDDYYCNCKTGFKLENRNMKENKEGCIECDCGKNGDCAVVKGQKKCKCNEKYAEKDGICQVCDCGEGSTCSFIRGAKACNCLLGYEFDAQVGKCREKNYCDPNPCIHGNCVKNGYDFLCVCEDPFTGRYCEISTCVETECLGGKCKIVDGKEYCICPKGYILESGVCRKSCENRTCFDGKCVILDDVETCICPPDHVLEGDFCRKTKCSNDSCIGGICEILANNVEDCTCPIGFTLKDNKCKRSRCVPGICYGGKCVKQDDGDLVCVCPKGYRLEDIGCKAIVCTKRNCFGGVCEVVDGEEICTCHDGYFLKDDVCEKMKCSEKSCLGGTCVIADGKEICTCPAEFALKDNKCIRQ